MGLTIAVLFVGTLVAGVSLAVRRVSDPALTWAIRFGIAISLVGMALGKLMADLPSGIDGVSGAHTVGAPDGTPGMPVTGWSTTHGDLRVPHFVGLHALQLLPLIAVLLAAGSKRIRRLGNATLRVRLVWIAAAGYAAVVVLTTWQAQRGQPLLHRDPTTASEFVLLAIVCVAAAGTAVRSGHGKSNEPAV
ncbi:hypothetical protein [Nocardia australiensis]|uniref:hypothetical protein n=1 Tax=Nocardia australiensis TaxID=2887191 RepID=UPI001D15BD5E|nr:hypothetical protein [Nocardia australiensis]